MGEVNQYDLVVDRREATPEEARALANPLRLRILRLCLDEALTNKQIADRLQRDPGTSLHHVRMLVEAGFLEATDVRTGAHGALEKPYRSTGKSWEVSVAESAVREDAHLAVVDAFRSELQEAGAGRTVLLARFANRLDDESLTDFTERLRALLEEFATRDDPGGTPFAFLVGGHQRADGDLSVSDAPAAPDR